MKEKFFDFLGSTQEQYKGFLSDIAPYAIKLILATLLLWIGIYVVKFIQNSIEQLIEQVKLDKILKKVGFDKFIEKTGHKLDSAKAIGLVVKWTLLLAVFLGALKILGLNSVVVFAQNILLVIGQIIVAFCIFAVAVVASRFIKTITTAVAKTLEIESSHLLEKIATGVIYLIALLTVLGMFKITEEVLYLTQNILLGIIFALSLAFGLAFGLGGKEKAKEILEKKK